MPANRLATSPSAYLRQHGYNPVDWYPWGEEALRKAKDEDRPILLSIGYSACHWCHVMERESFEDESIAMLMNTRFVCIKVDREERPDLDQIYQTVVQLMGRSGGWPLTVFLTPDQRPFYAGTYFPPVKRYGMPAFRDVLEAIYETYTERHDSVVAQAGELVAAIAELNQRGETVNPADLVPELLARAEPKLTSRFDARHGGFGTAPKFPNTMSLEVLLRLGCAGDSPVEASRMRVRKALDGMRAGGIWDHLGGGFHRYSTDERWLVPHFEKMLYDNALLLRLYLDAGRGLRERAYIEVAYDIATYLVREMKSPGGAFFATQDADSEGEEGKFFVWTPEEVEALLKDDELARVATLVHHGIVKGGNFEQTGATVLSEVMRPEAIAAHLNESNQAVNEALARARKVLFEARETRPRPFRDEKILACWNGLVIGALAELGAVLGDTNLITVAKDAFAHIERALIRGGHVDRFVTEQGGATFVASPGYLEDHASMANAALDLYEVTGEGRYAGVACAIADELLARFSDERGGFFVSASDTEALICRVKDTHDSATPSGSALAARLMNRLGAMLGDPYRNAALASLEAVAQSAIESPMGYGQTLLELDTLVRGSVDIVIVGAPDHPMTNELRRAVLLLYLPRRTVVTVDPTSTTTLEITVAIAREIADGKPAGQGGAPVAYVCRNQTCSAPVSSPEALRELLG